MANLTYYSANLINDTILGAVALTFPPTYYLGVSTTTISKDGTGATEPVDAVYERIAITNNKINFGDSVLGLITNLTEFIFDESTESWGVITDWFLADSLTNGNKWFYGTLNIARNVETATVLRIPVGSFGVTAS